MVGKNEDGQPKNKVERKYIQEQQPNHVPCYIQKMGFANRMDQNIAKYRIGNWMKKYWWSSFVWMVDVLFRVFGYYIVSSKMKAISF